MQVPLLTLPRPCRSSGCGSRRRIFRRRGPSATTWPGSCGEYVAEVQPRPADADGGAQGRTPTKVIEMSGLAPKVPRLHRHPRQQRSLARPAGDHSVRAAAAAHAQVPARRRQVPGPVRRVRPALQKVRALLDPGPAGRSRATGLRGAGAEGSAIVMAIIQTGKIEAIVGVSCLSVLEKAFPHMEAAAIPGIAIPLLQDDCADTNVDLEWVWDIIHLTSDDRTHRLDLDAVREEVDSAGSPPRTSTDILGPSQGETDEIGRAWLRQGRQALAAVPHRLHLQGPPRRAGRGPRSRGPEEGRDRGRVLPQGVAHSRRHRRRRRHPLRRGNPARGARRRRRPERRRLPLRRRLPPDRRVRRRAAEQGRDAPGRRPRPPHPVASGRGPSCAGRASPQPLSSLQVLEIFRQKTAPAFEVALRLGALYAGADERRPRRAQQVQRSARHRLPDPRRPGRPRRRRPRPRRHRRPAPVAAAGRRQRARPRTRSRSWRASGAAR